MYPARPESPRVPAILWGGLTLAAVLVLPGRQTPAVAAPIAPARPVAPAQEDLSNTLTQDEVTGVVAAAARALDDDDFAVSVVDRAGRILAVWRRPGASEADQELSLSLARTGAFFSNNQAPLSSRTVRFISGIHFPPGVKNQPNAALYGIENTNRVDYNVDFNEGKEFPAPLNIDGDGPSRGITTGKADLFDSKPNAVNPGGIPIFKNGQVAGGVGVAGVSPEEAEFAAFNASISQPGFGPRVPKPGVIFIEGIELPFVENKKRPRGSSSGEFPDSGAFRVEPSAGDIAPDGYLVGPNAGEELSEREVNRIIQNAVATAAQTRAAIRLPIGSRTRMVISVGDLDGTILGLFRMPDSTIFSVDVAVAKARNVVYFSSRDRERDELPGLPLGTAVTNRTISFGAQPLFPPGIANTRPGPFFDLFRFDTENPGTQGAQPANPNQNGIVFFPGSVPLYKSGRLVGGLGVSGDGVEQDDFVAQGGSKGFEAPKKIRADNFIIRNTRMPYLKFPRNPTR